MESESQSSGGCLIPLKCGKIARSQAASTWVPHKMRTWGFIKILMSRPDNFI
jgi:hypothetical protein